MKGAAIDVKSLEDLGVKHVFGYTGSAILPIIDELGKSSNKILLLNNLSDGMVKNLEDVAYGGRHSATVGTCDVNFAEMAE